MNGVMYCNICIIQLDISCLGCIFFLTFDYNPPPLSCPLWALIFFPSTKNHKNPYNLYILGKIKRREEIVVWGRQGRFKYIPPLSICYTFSPIFLYSKTTFGFFFTHLPNLLILGGG